MKPQDRTTDGREKPSRKRADRLAERAPTREKFIVTKKQKMEDLTRRAETAESRAELAERQERSISMELAKARRRIAELESLVGETR
jgi:predicted  nucleic acid-binding Zn-ribbon protein